MNKLLDIGPYFGNTYEPSLQILNVGPHCLLEKRASAMSEAFNFASSMEAKEGHTYILVIAMGAGEYYGCFLPGAPVTMADGTYKAIENITRGDYVITHTGATKKVTKVFTHEHTSDLHTYTMAGYHREVTCTQEHPIYTAKVEDIAPIRRQWYKRRTTYAGYTAKIPLEFVESEDVCQGDYVVTKFPTDDVVTPELGDNDMAYLLGYYMGNGCLAKRYDVTRKDHGTYYRCIIIVNQGRQDEVTRLTNIIKKLSGNQVNIFENYHGNYATRMEFIWKDFCDVALKYIGHLARNKYPKQKVLLMPREWQTYFLSGYLNADGCQTTHDNITSKYHGTLESSTVSINMVDALMHITFRLGFKASSLKSKQHYTSINAGGTIYVNIYEPRLVNELPFSRFIKVTPKGNSTMVCILDTSRGVALFPIKYKKVTNIINTQVHNLEIEDDNSYVAHGVVVHNCNRNSDFFPEKDLKLQYQNFETKYITNDKTNKKEISEGALFFKHHKNKVAKGNPWFGTVHKAFYNDRMHRVELIIDIHHERDGAMELIDKVNDGGDFSVSMGVNIPYDQCSHCGNKAKKQSEYCDHLKYELGRTRPDGTRIYAINGGYDYSKNKKALNFFDISYVFRPADKTGYMLKKVAMDMNTMEHTQGSAEAYTKLAETQEKSAALRKMSEITKYFQGQATALKDSSDSQLKVINRNPELFDNVVSQMQVLSPEHLDKLSKYPMGEILSTLADIGIILTTPEFIQVVVKKKLGVTLPLDTMKQFAVDQAKVFEELADNPEMVDALEEDLTMLKESSINNEIKDIVEDIRESRDLSPEGFIKKAGTSFLRSAAGMRSGPSPWADGRGMLDVEVVTDPKDGRKYYASMEAIDHANTTKLTGNIAKTVGGGALLAALFMATKKSKGIVAPAVGMGTLALGAKMLYDKVKKDDGSGYMYTDDGELIPGATAMIEKRSSIEKTATPGFSLGTRAATTIAPMAGSHIGKKYYEDRLHTGTAGTFRTDAEKYMDNAGRIAYTHPVLTAGAGVVGGHIALNSGEAIAKAARKLLGK